MANSITSAQAYINNQAELDKVFKGAAYTADIVKPNVAVGAKTVKYRKVAFGSSTLGDYDRSTGYAAKDINVTWVEKSLSQDKGDSLLLDKMDGEEAQGLEIAAVHNKYVRDIEAPSVDTYAFSAIVATSDIHTKTETLTASNVEAAVDAALDALYDNRVNGDVVIYLSTPVARLLTTAAKKTGSISFGNWNGNLTAEVSVYGDRVKGKIVQVPSSILGSGVNFIVAHPDAVGVFIKYKEAVYFDKIPGHGGRKTQIDTGIYYDAWVEPEAEKAVYVSKTA